MKVQKNSIFKNIVLYKIFCNILNVFTVTFDKFNRSMLKKVLKKY